MRVLSQDHLEVNVDVEVEVEGMVEVVATQTKPSAKVIQDLRLEKRRLPSLGIFVSVCSKVCHVTWSAVHVITSPPFLL